MPAPVSAQICTLNEAANIVECLKAVMANSPEDIVVIDGGSEDNTVELARQSGVRVLEVGRIGLAGQRRAGYLTSTSEYTAFIDADDRIAPTWLATMVEEFEHGGYSALQSCLRVPQSDNWWESSWNQYFMETIRPTTLTTMVGRPALYRTSDLMATSNSGDLLMEDTGMSRDFEIRGLKQGIGTAVAFRTCPSTRSENFAKWQSYGRGYRQFVLTHPERRSSILKHIFVTIPFARTWRPVLRGHVSQPAFGLMSSFNIARGYFSG